MRYLHVEATSGIVLLACTVAALALANSPVADGFLDFWNTPAGLQMGQFELHHSLRHWINDGLMAIFFFVIGLEVKRELVLGELRELRRAILPVVAAVGGMVVPAGLYLALQAGEPAERGWGVPMATDIAFVVGCMALLGSRVPAALRVMLLSLAIVDDIGAILVIALGYTHGLHVSWLAFGACGIGAVFLLERLGVRSMLVYTIIGVLIWLGFHESGVHATIAGVILGLMTPARPYLENGITGEWLATAGELFHGGSWTSDPHRARTIGTYRRATKETISPLEFLIDLLHPWVAFVIMPVFALANAGVPIDAADVVSSTALAVMIGLVVGKPTGILLFCWLAVKFRAAELPSGVRWRQMFGGGCLAGIGFTMALFITGLALADDSLARAAKVGVLIGSFLSALAGMAILGTSSKDMPSPSDET